MTAPTPPVRPASGQPHPAPEPHRPAVARQRTLTVADSVPASTTNTVPCPSGQGATAHIPPPSGTSPHIAPPRRTAPPARAERGTRPWTGAAGPRLSTPSPAPSAQRVPGVTERPYDTSPSTGPSWAQPTGSFSGSAPGSSTGAPTPPSTAVATKVRSASGSTDPSAATAVPTASPTSAYAASYAASPSTAPTPVSSPLLARPRAKTRVTGAAPRALPSVLCGMLTLSLAAVTVLAAALWAPVDTRRVVVLGGAAVGALLLALAVAVAHRALRATQLLRDQLDAMTGDTGRLLGERARLGEELARERELHTEELRRERDRGTDALARERDRLDAEMDRERERLTTETVRLTEEAARLAAETDRVTADRAASLAACANAAGRLQALTTDTLAELRRMEDEHTDEDVLADLLHIDHRTAQTGRVADSVAVLTGARSGRRWARPIVMESILRGAMGRINAYQRVRVHSTSEIAIVGHAAEGVMHALAEILDNAANFSPPAAEVHVYVEEVPAGVIVSVEDSGLVMSEFQLRRAERAVSGDASGLGGLSGTRLGLAVVGRLARKHGLTVSFRPSARGGTGVVVMVPRNLLTGLDAVPARHGALPDTFPDDGHPDPGHASDAHPAPAPVHTHGPAQDRTHVHDRVHGQDPASPGPWPSAPVAPSAPVVPADAPVAAPAVPTAGQATPAASPAPTTSATHDAPAGPAVPADALPAAPATPALTASHPRPELTAPAGAARPAPDRPLAQPAPHPLSFSYAAARTSSDDGVDIESPPSHGGPRASAPAADRSPAHPPLRTRPTTTARATPAGTATGTAVGDPYATTRDATQDAARPDHRGDHPADRQADHRTAPRDQREHRENRTDPAPGGTHGTPRHGSPQHGSAQHNSPQPTARSTARATAPRSPERERTAGRSDVTGPSPADTAPPADPSDTRGPSSPADPTAAAPLAARPGSLPVRPRGRTLATAEARRFSDVRFTAPRPIGEPVDIKARAARFSSFREAVRATPPAPDPAPQPSAHRVDPHHQEGDLPR
ncbi:ATP-binding protein [Streptomyces uncialis]|uniref:ATP-binding protein n=1 Tax=Streptomyces uncialis TaxID=1048205 RepID=UPI00364C5365